jgi:CheY-like chemotaxis protein/PAS domain-containing protein
VILHRQLKALLHRLGVEEAQPPDEDRWLALLVLLNDRFRQFEEDRHRLQRSLDIHSREVQSLYRELTQERDKVSSALACLDTALLLLDGQGRPLLISAESELRLGYSESELEGKDLLVMLGLDPYLPPGGLTALLSNLRPVTLTVPLKTRDGQVETQVHLQPLIRDRQLIGCLLQLSDPSQPQEEDEEEETTSYEEVAATSEDMIPAPLEPALVEAQPKIEPPKAPPAAPAPQAEPPKPDAEKSPPPLRILLVESDPEAAQNVTEHLARLQHRCTHTTDALEGLRLYQESPFDAIMCCEEPAQMSGVELCKRLRQDSRGGYPYFILMTPPGARLQATKALEAGVDAFLNKPLEAVELQVRLKVARGVQTRLNRVYSNLLPGQKTKEA